MVFLAPSKLLRLSASKKWDCAISGQPLGSYSALSTLHDTECSEKSMGKLTAAGSEAPAVKRKRGRPRKADTLAGQAAAGGTGAPPPVKRKRGRPRKADTLAAQAAATDIGPPPVKRKRGRPRKVDILAAQVAAGGTAAVESVASAPSDNVVGLVSDSDYDESLFTASSDSDSDSSSDSDYVDDDEAIPNLTHSFQSDSSSDSDCDDDDGQATPNQTESSEHNSSSESDSDEEDHSSDEDFNHLYGHTRQGKKKRRKRRRNGDKVNYKEASTGEICHWCRQRSERLHVQCSFCVIKFCPACLMNRHGEKIQEETRIGVRWVCPRCRDGCGPGCKNCCNCGPCRRSQGKPPTGSLAHTARRAGFSNVHDYLINLKTGESAEVIARRKEGRGWTYATGAVGVSSIPPWGMKGQRTPKIPLGFLISKCREGREDAMAYETAETAQVALPSFASEQDSCTIQEKTGDLCRKFAEFGTEGTQGGEDMLTSPDAVDYQFSSSDSDVSGSPLRTSMEAGVSENWRTRGAIPKRQRSARKRTARKEERDLNEVEHEKRPDVDMSHRGKGAGEDQAGLPDLNTLCEVTFELPDLNSPIIMSDGVTNSYCSGQEITGVRMCSGFGRHVPLSAESPESSFSVRTQVTSANEADAATSTQVTSAAATSIRGDGFRAKLDLILQRPFSSEQLKEMWDHFMFHRPSQQEEYTHHGSSDEEADELLCDYFSDLYEKLARTFSAVEKLKLLRAFFFWLQHSSMEGAFQPWVTDGEDDQFGGCTPISISDSQVIDRLLAIDGNICKSPFITCSFVFTQRKFRTDLLDVGLPSLL